MTIKFDAWIQKIAEQRMIRPFAAHQVRQINHKKIIPYGLSSYGYDIRCTSEFKVLTNTNNTILDPKNFTQENFVTIR